MYLCTSSHPPAPPIHLLILHACIHVIKMKWLTQDTLQIRTTACVFVCLSAATTLLGCCTSGSNCSMCHFLCGKQMHVVHKCTGNVAVKRQKVKTAQFFIQLRTGVSLDQLKSELFRLTSKHLRQTGFSFGCNLNKVLF